MIRVKNLVKKYAGAAAPVLKGVDFELKPGTLAAFLGGSGAGKTTLLRCLVGLEAFESGEIEIDGVTVKGTEGSDEKTRLAARAQLRSKVGLVFQSFELFPHLRVLDNLTLAPIRVKGVSRADAEAKGRELLAKVGLKEKEAAYPDHLSGGQKQRVAIARALCMEPRVLLYDEPTSALDPSLKMEVANTLKSLCSTGITQIVVTHDVPIARAACETVIILDQGKVAEMGAPADVLDSPRTEATKKLLGSH
jgi:ABC-type polar amino acid transport system ATPase subunit